MEPAPDPAEGLLVLGGLEIDAAGHRAAFRGRALQLSSSQFELLAILVANHRRVVSRAELSEHLGLERGRSVDVMLSMLRRELGCDFVRNVRKRGWIVIPEALAPAGADDRIRLEGAAGVRPSPPAQPAPAR
jgi:DNA-binding response OmpR family regulator